MLSACNQEEPKVKRADRQEIEKQLMEANQHVVKTEARHIEDFLARYKWDMKETGSGLFYMIYEQGTGEKAAKGMVATIAYTIKLITGDIVYSSESAGPLAFQIGKGDVISGLEEGILLLKRGDKAKFIIPSHLAYGLVGDGDLIPGKATLIYDIELLKID